MREFFMTSTGGSSLRCGLWMPMGQPRAMVQLIHGVAEHVGRYDDFSTFLTRHGIAVVGDDHMGHGKSIGPNDVPGYFPTGWQGAVEDEHRLMTEIRKEFPHTPYFLLGHSMGSFLARTFLYRYPNAELTGAILSGTGWVPGMVLAAGKRLCQHEKQRIGADQVSPHIQKIVFGSFNLKFRPNRTEADWICTDPAVVDAYLADPLCGVWPTVGMAEDILDGLRSNQQPEHLAQMDRELPILFFSGQEDPVGAMGRGVRRSAKAFEQAGMKHVTCRLYEGGRHEMLNEPQRETVYQDVLQWIEALLQ